MAISFSSTVLNRTTLLKNTIQNNSTDFFLTFIPKTKHTRSSNNTNDRFLILDSSFNPPTKAHSSLLLHTLASYPPNFFNASMLLFSTNNADKHLTGASILQRAQMMEILARQWDEEAIPVYVGLTTQARFIDKLTVIKTWYQQQQLQKQNHDYGDVNVDKEQLELYFILGYDTITRFMDAKYYSPLKVEDALAPFFSTCYLVCVDRPGFNEKEEKDNEKSFWSLPQVQYYMHRIRQVPTLDGSISSISSTLARKLITEQNYLKLNEVLDLDIIQFILQEKIYQP
ncbi:hypothetical protein BJ944DRAFT_259254 [Cunninghamella echinulata]|nr:hypothetical protein BJ944DRAFT_259254 [Cunninghamella echinulata]